MNDEIPHRIEMRSSAAKELRSLDRPHAERVIASIRKLSTNPRPPGCRKLTAQDARWRIRIGDYRIVYFIDDDSRIVYVERIAHRREVYRL